MFSKPLRFTYEKTNVFTCRYKPTQTQSPLFLMAVVLLNAPTETRTRTLRILSALSLPIGVWEQMLSIVLHRTQHTMLKGVSSYSS